MKESALFISLVISEGGSSGRRTCILYLILELGDAVHAGQFL